VWCGHSYPRTLLRDHICSEGVYPFPTRYPGIKDLEATPGKSGVLRDLAEKAIMRPDGPSPYCLAFRSLKTKAQDFC
jgi:hypothetical protein